MEIPAVKIGQAGKTMFVGRLSIKELRTLSDNHQLAEDLFNPDKKKGYQRIIVSARVNELANDLSNPRFHSVLPPILPGSVVLNCRMPNKLFLSADSGRLVIEDDAKLHIVDGQHRIKALLQSTVSEYDIPVTFLNGFDLKHEAALFLTINTKQKKVKPDLELRVLYHMDRVAATQLVNALRIDNWKMETVGIVVALNEKRGSPWRNLIKRPGERNTRSTWKPMSEGNFESTLSQVSAPEGSLSNVGTDRKVDFLIDYWKAVKAAYPDAFDPGNGDSYVVCKSIGVGIFNALAPLIYWLECQGTLSLLEFKSKLKSKVTIDQWRSPMGRYPQMGTSYELYRNEAQAIAKKIDKGFSYLNQSEFKRISHTKLAGINKKTLDNAYRTLSPLNLRSSTEIAALRGDEYGCYVLWRKKPNGDAGVYVGRAIDAKRRIGQHSRPDLFACRTIPRQQNLDTLEQALYHLVRANLRENRSHPPSAVNCPYC